MKLLIAFLITNSSAILLSIKVSYIRDFIRYVIDKPWAFINKLFVKEKAPEPKEAPMPNPAIEHKSLHKEIKIGSLSISISSNSFIFRNL